MVFITRFFLSLSLLAPLSPRFIAEQCLCHDEQSGGISGTLAWSVRDIGAVQGFILELDDGTFASDFRVSNETLISSSRQ